MIAFVVVLPSPFRRCRPTAPRSPWALPSRRFAVQRGTFERNSIGRLRLLKVQNRPLASTASVGAYLLPVKDFADMLRADDIDAEAAKLIPNPFYRRLRSTLKQDQSRSGLILYALVVETESRARGFFAHHNWL